MMTREEFQATIIKLRAAGQDDEQRRLILKDIPLMVHKHLDRYSNRELTYEQLFETI